jgi:hypothetical protein
MKSIFISFFLLVFSSINGQFSNWSIKGKDCSEVEILQIDFREYSTLVHMRYKNVSAVGNLIYIDENFHIRDNKTGTTYKLLNSFNLPISSVNKYAFIKNPGEYINFTLEFEKLPDEVFDIDLIENKDKSSFNFYGIEMNKEITEDSMMNVSSFIGETPVKEMSYYYKDGSVVQFYQEDGIRIAMLITYDYNYGRYYQANLIIQNISGREINFIPDLISAKLDTELGYLGKVLSHSEYMRKVRKKQNWQAFAVSFGESLNASKAGYSTSAGQMKSEISRYGFNGTRYKSAYGSSYSSLTYNSTDAYFAQQNAGKNIESFQAQQYEVKHTLSEEYIKLNTIMNESQYLGYFNIEFKEADRILITIPFGKKSYDFVYNFKQK